jgi:hypothetical protein
MPTYPFQLPTASDVLDETGLQPEQVNNAPERDALEEDAAGRIERKAALVAGKLARAASPHVWPFTDTVMQTAYPAYDADQIAAELEVQSSNLTEYVSLLTQDSLYRSARQWSQAELVRDEAKELWDTITGSVDFVVGMQPGDAPSSGVAVWTITTGDVYSRDEYSTC